MSGGGISRRRQIITCVLLVLAVLGGVVRWLAPQPSLARDLGSLLLVLWLPIVGNIIAWLIQRAKTPKYRPPGFGDAPFEAHARLRVTLLANDVPLTARPIRAGYFNCLLAVGSEAFSARIHVPAGQEPAPEVAAVFAVQFLRPEVAGPKLPPGTAIALLSGRTLLATGQVLAPAAEETVDNG